MLIRFYLLRLCVTAKIRMRNDATEIANLNLDIGQVSLVCPEIGLDILFRN